MTRTHFFFTTIISLWMTLPAAALEVGDFAPCVVLDDIQTDGSVIEQCIRTPNKKGEFVVLDFFTPKCDDCIANLEAVDALATDVATTTTTRMVGIERKKENILDFIHEHDAKINVPVSLDLRSNAATAYGVVAVPTLFVLNAKNRIVFKHLGPLTPEAATALKKVVH